MSTFVKAGVIGFPVTQSLSPLIHNYWLNKYGITADYQKISVAPGMLKENVRAMIGEGFRGFNVTIPYKQEIIALCDELDETAVRIGAVNTVVVREDGTLLGRNTDSFGFAENLRQAKAADGVKGKTALVLGAGGAARAVIHALLDLGMEKIRLTNRTREKAEQIAQDFPVDIIGWDDRENAANDIALLVNTTSLGMTGQSALEFNISALSQSAAVCDIVYKPLYTQLLQDAAKRGNPVITGIGMLLHQAQPAFEAWFGVFPEVDEKLCKLMMEGAQ